MSQDQRGRENSTASKTTRERLRSYPSGLAMTELIRRENPVGTHQTFINSYDSLGESVFGVIVQHIDVVTDDYAYTPLSWVLGLPNSIERVSKEYGMLTPERKGLSLSSLEEWEKRIERIHYRYDDVGRVVEKFVFHIVPSVGEMSGDIGKNSVAMPVESARMYYDDQSRISAIVESRFTYDGIESVNPVVLFTYRSSGNGFIEVTESKFSDFFRIPTERLLPQFVQVRVIDPQTNKTEYYAIYQDERERNGMHMTNEQFLMRNPVITRMYKKALEEPTLTFLKSHRDELLRDWEGAPDIVDVPSYVTPESIGRFLQGGPFLSLSEDKEENPVRVLFFEEYVEEVGYSSDEQSIQLAMDILLGNIKTGIFVPEVQVTGGKDAVYEKYAWLRRATKSMSSSQRLAVAVHFIPHMVFYMLNGQYSTTSVEQYRQFVTRNIIGLTREDEHAAISAFRSDVTGRSNEQEIILSVLNNLDTYETALFRYIDVFSRILTL